MKVTRNKAFVNKAAWGKAVQTVADILNTVDFHQRIADSLPANPVAAVYAEAIIRDFTCAIIAATETQTPSKP